MKSFLMTVAAGVAVGVILNRMRPQPQAGTKAEDYSSADFAAWSKAQGQG